MAEHKYGVVYTPSNVSAQRMLKPLSEEFLDSLGVEFIRVTWVDFINNVRYRVVPRDYFKRLLASPRPGVSLTVAALGLVGLQVAPGFTGTGEHLYVLDAARTFRLCPYAPGHASVMGFFQYKTPSPTFGLTVPLCPRALLAQVVNAARDQAGVKFLVGFESEFILLREAALPALAPVNDADWSMSSKLPSGSVELVVMDEIARSLRGAGIELQMYHAEAAPGQYEVVTGPLEPLEAADALVSTRETIYNVASKHGLRATFAPRLYTTSCGSAAHAHVSVHRLSSSNPLLHRERADAALAPTLSPAERSFLSGILQHAPALCALTLPTAASYARVADGAWSGGTYAVWGTENREAIVRLTGSAASGHQRFEVRFLDGTACPHVALAALLSAGTDAVRQVLPLRVADCEKPVVLMNDEEKRRVGVCDQRGQLVVGRLPRTVAKARQNLAEDREMHRLLGAEFVEKYLAVNETLEKHLKAENDEDEMYKLVKFY